ncbi:hypothetical protein OG21DRAFT_1526347 [Imleria badia]|nr:hypothetical protein OG21DRAFT_1526347 [Imleria badia]
MAARELKAGLPASFNGKSEDARRWILSMETYFKINPDLYDQKKRVYVTLNNMGEGRGGTFAEAWYDKINATPAANLDATVTFDLFKEDFMRTFFPINLKQRAQDILEMLEMHSTKKGLPADCDAYSDYVTTFHSAFSQAGLADDDRWAMRIFVKGLAPHIAEMVLSQATVPENITAWIKDAGKFHDHLSTYWSIRQGGQHNFSSIPACDPNAMDIDAIRLSPTERARHLKDNLCFICHKHGCSTRMHRGNTPRGCGRGGRLQGPQPATHVCAATTKPAPVQTPLAQYIESIEGKGQTQEQILKTLQIVTKKT